ncbi:sensor histidine kinase [Paenibacillus sp. NPDC056722]|uniref:sensor histidine kinase n=1 Tax=Paenibacillus sp. NPDC056722 TaxID=3345924 RepID=UPI0036A7CF93
MKIKRIIWKWFSGMTFKSKLLTVFIPLIVVSLSILGVVSSEIFSRSLINRSVNDVIDQSSLIINKLDSITKNMEICSNMLVTDVNRLYDNFPIERTAVEENQFRLTIQSRLAIDLSLFAETDAAVFIDSNGKIYTSYPARNDESEAIRSGVPEELLKQGNYGSAYWFPMQKRNYMTPNPDVPVLTLGKVVININTGERYGTLFLIIKEPTLSASLVSGNNINQKNYFLVDERRIIVASPDKEQVLTPITNPTELALLKLTSDQTETATRNTDGKRLITVTDYPGMQWKLLNVADLDVLTKDVGKNTKLTILIGFTCLLLSLLGAHFLSKVVLNPLQDLTKRMRRVMDGNLYVEAPVHTNDEIGLISRVFNSMIKQIQELLQNKEKEQKRKREYELALITSQVKPHFLYNTLDTIYILNDMDRNQEARDTTKALADFYRVVLSKGRELIILDQEIKMTTDYLSIMQMRYPDVFQYEIRIPQELRNTPIPKLSLQPLVENAIYHGLKTKGERGLIVISAVKEKAKIILRVEDDGVGMSEEQLKEACCFQEEEKVVKSIGVYSVQERIKLYFGAKYGLTIFSEEGKGTRVDITVPGGKTGGKADVPDYDRGR